MPSNLMPASLMPPRPTSLRLKKLQRRNNKTVLIRGMSLTSCTITAIKKAIIPSIVSNQEISLEFYVSDG